MIECAVLYGEKITVRTMLCAGVCFAGVVLMSGFDEGASLKGILIAFASGITYSAYTVLLGHSGLPRMHPFVLQKYIQTIGVAIMIPLQFLRGGLSVPLSSAGLLSLAGCTLFGFIGRTCYQVGVRKTDSQTAALISAFEPVTSIIISIVFMHDAFTGENLIGMAMVIAAVLFVSLRF
jgi:drug/metabolite transporter (DMT)-like permease